MNNLVIAFDADDTLWHNETLFALSQQRFRDLLEPYRLPHWTGQELYAVELANLEYFGYGIKGFTLSMIETAIQLTDGQISGRDVAQIIDFAKQMIRSPVQLLEHVAEIVPQLAATHTLMLITKGDLFDQESKIAQSGLAAHFSQIEIVGDKSAAVYRALLAKHRIAPEHFLMIGNSLRSDILPVLEIGGRAAYVPYQITWEHEHAQQPHETTAGYFTLEHLGQLPALIQSFEF